MKRIANSTWAEIRTAYASGIGLRELARNMGIPAGTVLARSKREGWTQQIAAAKLIERPQLARELVKPDAIGAITVTQSVARTMAERGQRHVERMAGITERGVEHVETMEPDAMLSRIDEIEKLDRVARRTFGIADNAQQQPINVLVNIGPAFDGDIAQYLLPTDRGGQ